MATKLTEPNIGTQASGLSLRFGSWGGGIFDNFSSNLIIEEEVEVMFFLLFSLGGIYWYQVPKCIFSEILRKKIEKFTGEKGF